MNGNSVFERYIRRYASRHLKGDDAKLMAIERLCRDGSTHHRNDDSQKLAQLLRDQQNNILHLSREDPLCLQRMKDVRVPQRFGDSVFLPKDAKVFVIGDTHGDLNSTCKIIKKIRISGAMESGAFVVFLGDYVNNGLKCWQNLVEILSFQGEYPDSVVLLSGNHEFKESYRTALNEHFHVHWERFSVEKLPIELQDRLPELDNHYAHMRLDLVRAFGFEEGERLYSACFDWGLALPCMCIAGDLMISHSLGKVAGQNLELADLLFCKQHDVENLRRIGFETWHKNRASLHAALVNNRAITSELLCEFAQVFNVNQFVVGHCHYRSADTLHFGENSVTTIVSSDPFSPDSGHYMFQQMMLERKNKRLEENLKNTNAAAGYLEYSTQQCSDGRKRLSLIEID